MGFMHNSRVQYPQNEEYKRNKMRNIKGIGILEVTYTESQNLLNSWNHRIVSVPRDSQGSLNPTACLDHN